MSLSPNRSALDREILDGVNVGIFTVDAGCKVLSWNRFMEMNSSVTKAEVVGKTIFEVFPSLPRAWLERKIRSVFLLGNFGFVSWRQRPYLLAFPHNRPVTGGVTHMQQDCTLIPLRGEDGAVEAVCIALADATDAAMLQRETEQTTARLREAMDEVAHRTLAAGRILDNVKFGFLVVGPELVVREECTRSCASLLSATTVAGESLVDLLRLQGDQAEAYLASVEQVFADVFPEDVALSQMPKAFRIGNREVRAEASVVRDAAGTVEGLLYTLSDVTELVAAQQENANNRMLLGIMRNRESFQLFVDDTRRLLACAEHAVALGDDATLRRLVHTIKGNSSCYGLTDIVHHVHAVEEGPITAASLASIRDAFGAFLREHGSVLGLPVRAFDGDPELLAGAASPESRGCGERPAGMFLGPIETFTRQLAARLGKEVELRVTGMDAPVDEKRMRPVLLNLVHLVRNAVDHGIEPMHARGAKGEAGHLEVALSVTPSRYEVTVSVDGDGIDLDRLGARAVERGVLDAAALATMSEEARYQLVFDDGVSTAALTTDLSGRGVGMSSVLAAVRDVGGAVTIASARGKGTTFSIVVPRS